METNAKDKSIDKRESDRLKRKTDSQVLTNANENLLKAEKAGQKRKNVNQVPGTEDEATSALEGVDVAIKKAKGGKGAIPGSSRGKGAATGPKRSADSDDECGEEWFEEQYELLRKQQDQLLEEQSKKLDAMLEATGNRQMVEKLRSTLIEGVDEHLDTVIPDSVPEKTPVKVVEKPTTKEPPKDSTTTKDPFADLLSTDMGENDEAGTDDFLNQFFASDETTGPAVSGILAKIVDSVIRGPSDKNTDKIAEEYHRPENCQNLVVPRTNDEIWPKLQRRVRQRDFQFQNIQGVLIKAMIPVIELMDIAIQSKDRAQMKKLSDSFKLSCEAFKNLSLRRRDLLGGELSPRYRQLCNPNTPATSMLFGDDLHQRVKQLDETSRLAFRVQRNSPLSRGSSRGTFRGSRGFRGTGRGGQRFQSQRPFLGRGGSFQRGRRFYGNQPSYQHQQNQSTNPAHKK